MKQYKTESLSVSLLVLSMFGAFSVQARSCLEAYNAESNRVDRTCRPFKECMELGYEEDSCTNDEKVLTCPYDDGFKLCIKEPCMGYNLAAVQREDGKFYLTDNVNDVASATLNYPISGSVPASTEYGELEYCDINGRASSNLDSPGYKYRLYRYKKCNDDSMFSGGLCITGCNRNECENKVCYPYTNRAALSVQYGVIGDCQDTSGKYYGYISCHSGYTRDSMGSCVLNTCPETDYVYSESNRPSSDRGRVEPCYVGGGVRYAYSSCNEGMLKTYSNKGLGICTKDFEFGGNMSGLQVGDYITYQGERIGVVYHIERNGKVRVISIQQDKAMPFSILSAVTTTSNSSICIIPQCDGNGCSIITAIDKDGNTVNFETKWTNSTQYSIPDVSTYKCSSTQANGKYYAYNDDDGYYNTKKVLEFNNVKNVGSSNAGYIDRNYPYCAARYVDSYPDFPVDQTTHKFEVPFSMKGKVSDTSRYTDIFYKDGNSSDITWITACGNADTAKVNFYYKDEANKETFREKLKKNAQLGSGNWYIPGEKELTYIYENRYLLNASLWYVNDEKKLTTYQLNTGSWYWSSTENSANYSWFLGFSSGLRGFNLKGHSYYVRPVLAF